MLKRILAFTLAGATALLVTIKLLLDMASMASTIEFLKKHFPPLIRVFKQTPWLLTGLAFGFVGGLSFQGITPHNSQHQVNSDAHVLNSSASFANVGP